MPTPNHHPGRRTHFPPLDEILQIRPHRSLPPAHPPTPRHPQPRRMQRMPRQKQSPRQSPRPPVRHPLDILRPIPRIQLVPHQRMPPMRQMHPDLMHPPRLRKTSHHRETPLRPLKSPLHRKPRHTLPPRLMHNLPHPDRRRPHTPRPHNPLPTNPLILLRPTIHHRQILLLRLPPLKHPTQLPRRPRMLRNQNQPARLPIQPRHNPRTSPVLQLIRQQMLHPAQQRRLRLVIRRMHNQRRRLVHDKPIIALVDHPEIHHHLQAHPHSIPTIPIPGNPQSRTRNPPPRQPETPQPHQRQ